MDWSNFFPMPYYENDFSNWLALLIQESEKSDFSKQLLGVDYEKKPKKVIRENSLQNEEDKSKRRTDLTILWDNNNISHTIF